MTYPANYDAFTTKVNIGQVISAEAHTIPATTPFTATLLHIPRHDTPSSIVVIGNYTPTFAETTSPTPSLHEFYVNYVTGQFTFNAGDSNDPLHIDYVCVGEDVMAEHVNELQDTAVDNIEHTIGLNPQGSKADLNARITISLKADGTLQSDVVDNSKVIALAGIASTKLANDTPEDDDLVATPTTMADSLSRIRSVLKDIIGTVTTPTWLDTIPITLTEIANNDAGYIVGADVPDNETDPVFTQWLSDTPPLYSETDPVFTQWLSDTPPLYSETDPDYNANSHAVGMDQGVATDDSPEFTGIIIDETITITTVPTAVAGVILPFTNGAVAMALGEVGYVNSSGTITKALGTNATAGTATAIVICADASIGIGTLGNYLLVGTMTNSGWSFTAGNKIYLSPATAGAITDTIPSGTGDIVQILGVAISATTVLFSPNLTTVEILSGGM